MPSPFRRIQNGSPRFGGPANYDPAYSSQPYHFSRARAHELNRTTDVWLPLFATGGVALALLLIVALPGLLGGGGGSLASPSAGSSSSQLDVTVVTPPSSASPTIALSAPPSETAAPPPSYRTYTVKAGDTVTKIANKFGLKVWELLLANPDLAANPDNLYVGTVLNIPVHGQLTPAP